MTTPHPAARWVRPSILRMPAATPFRPAVQLMKELGLSELVRLGANENPLGPAPRALAALAQAAGDSHYYPDASNMELRQALGARLGLPAAQVLVDLGASGVLRLMMETFVQPGDKVVYPWPTFPLYLALIDLVDGVGVPVPLTADGRHDFAALAAAARDAKAVILCNPNNPTGRDFSQAELAAFLDAIPEDCVVAVDEAYYEFATGEPTFGDGMDLVRQGRRLLVMRTFSKAHGLAGIRVGYAACPEDWMDAINRAREPFAVSNLAQAAALAALDDEEHVARSVRTAREGRAFLADVFASHGFPALPSSANFVLAHLGRDCRPVAGALLKQGVMVRACDDLFGMPGWMRVSCGTPEQNRKFADALARVLAGG